jgi:hypothetical protein
MRGGGRADSVVSAALLVRGGGRIFCRAADAGAALRTDAGWWRHS